VDHGRIQNAMMFQDLKPREDRPLRRRTSSLQGTDGSAILHLRNPYDAIVSWYNHVITGHAYGGGLPGDELEERLATQHFCDFAVSEASDWRELVSDWSSSGLDLLVTKHEAFLKDPESELERVAHFLKVPLSERRLNCLRRHQMNAHLRPKQNEQKRSRAEFFCPAAVEAVEKALEEAGEVMKEYLGDNLLEEYSLQSQ